MPALENLKIIELCTMNAGPYCGKVLADLGAEVIKVEPLSGDPSRRSGPFPQDIPHPERSGTFFYLNTNKLGITLDVESRTGQHIMRQLLQQADVFLEDWPPGALDALDLGYNALSQTSPALVVTSITPFGQTGPYRNYKAHPLNTYHAGGEGYTTPGSGAHLGWNLYSDRPPLNAPGNAGEQFAGVQAALATLMAVFGRSGTGRGQHVDVSKLEGLMNLSRGVLVEYPNQGVIENRASYKHPIGGPFQCKGGYVQIGINNDAVWKGLVDLMGNPEWALKEEYATRPGRTAHGEVINDGLAEWCLTQTRDYIYHEGQARGIPISPYLTPSEVYASPQYRHRGYFVDVEFPGAGKVAMASAPYHFTRTPWSLRRPAPGLGEHNQEVLGERLGYSKEDIVRLRACGII